MASRGWGRSYCMGLRAQSSPPAPGEVARTRGFTWYSSFYDTLYRRPSFTKDLHIPCIFIVVFVLFMIKIL